MTAKKKVAEKVPEKVKKVEEAPAVKRRVVRMARPFRTDAPQRKYRSPAKR